MDQVIENMRAALAAQKVLIAKNKELMGEIRALIAKNKAEAEKARKLLATLRPVVLVLGPRRFAPLCNN